LPLLTVEWHPERRFQLTASDADCVLQIGGGDLLWQKERLLNFAAAALPASCAHIAWLDCDVVFATPDWQREARRLLKESRVIQLFSEVVRLDESESGALAQTEVLDPARFGATSKLTAQQSFLAAFGKLKHDIVRFDLDRRFKSTGAEGEDTALRAAPGLAWASPASFMRDIGLYDRCIMGGGD